MPIVAALTTNLSACHPPICVRWHLTLYLFKRTTYISFDCRDQVPRYLFLGRWGISRPLFTGEAPKSLLTSRPALSSDTGLPVIPELDGRLKASCSHNNLRSHNSEPIETIIRQSYQTTKTATNLLPLLRFYLSSDLTSVHQAATSLPLCIKTQTRSWITSGSLTRTRGHDKPASPIQPPNSSSSSSSICHLLDLGTKATKRQIYRLIHSR